HRARHLLPSLLQSSRPHRDLHSFPTRRSSDLWFTVGPVSQIPYSPVTELLIRWRAGDEEALTKLVPLVYEELRQIARRQLRGERSEEHTSELQSLAYLVCRLLLEKKKQNIT